MYANSHGVRNGFTLIELIVSLLILMILLSVLLLSFQLPYKTYESQYDATTAVDNLRYLSTILETQIRRSPTIYVVNGRIYLKDMESPEYYNFYSFNSHMVIKTKTDRYLDSIGLGSTSQIAEGLDEFVFSYTDRGSIEISLAIVEGEKTYRVEKEVMIHLSHVVVIGN